MTTRDRKANEDLRAINKELDNQEKTKKEHNKVKNFFKKPIVYIVLTVIVTLAAVFGTYKLYEFVFSQGVQYEQNRQATINKEVAARSKTPQQ